MVAESAWPIALSEEQMFSLLLSVVDPETGVISETGLVLETPHVNALRHHLVDQSATWAAIGWPERGVTLLIVRFADPAMPKVIIDRIHPEGAFVWPPGSDVPTPPTGAYLVHPTSVLGAYRRLATIRRQPILPPAAEERRRITHAVEDGEIPGMVFRRLSEGRGYLAEYAGRYDTDRARRWFDKRWLEAEAKLTTPPIESVGEAIAVIEALEQAVARWSWIRPNIERDQSALRAVLDKAREGHAVRFHMGDREGASRAGMPLRTYQRARQSLMAKKWFEWRGDPRKWGRRDGQKVRWAGWYRLPVSAPPAAWWAQLCLWDN